jgi:hypothetical protein
MGILGVRMEECRPLGTQAGRVGAILLIVASHHGAILQEEGSSYTKFGVGSITVAGLRLSDVDQLLFGDGKFIER